MKEKNDERTKSALQQTNIQFVKLNSNFKYCATTNDETSKRNGQTHFDMMLLMIIEGYDSAVRRSRVCVC